MIDWKRELAYVNGDTLQSLKTKYKQLALSKHPNKGGSVENFQALETAWRQAQIYFTRAPSPSVAQNMASRAPNNETHHHSFVLPRLATKGLGYKSAPFLKISTEKTVRDLFQLIVHNAHAIETIFGPFQSPRLALSDGFNVTISPILPEQRIKPVTFTEPVDIQLSQIFPRVPTRPLHGGPLRHDVFIDIWVHIRRKRQSKQGWYYPVTQQPQSAAGPKTVEVEVVRDQYQETPPYRRTRIETLITLPENLTVLKLYKLIAQRFAITDDFTLLLYRKTLSKNPYHGSVTHHGKEPRKRIRTPTWIKIETQGDHTRWLKNSTAMLNTIYFRPSESAFKTARRGGQRGRKQWKPIKDRPIEARVGAVAISKRGNVYGIRKRVQASIRTGRVVKKKT